MIGWIEHDLFGGAGWQVLTSLAIGLGQMACQSSQQLRW
jgi:hypothetical protein